MAGMSVWAICSEPQEVPAPGGQVCPRDEEGRAHLTPSWKPRSCVGCGGQVVKAQGKIVLATVKGDVTTLQEHRRRRSACNNYEVIDMGVMVSCERILERATAEKADIIGLSGSSRPPLTRWFMWPARWERQGSGCRCSSAAQPPAGAHASDCAAL